MTYEKLYTSGQYADRNPGWHADESPWKARAIARILQRNRLRPGTVIDVGCGVGEVLACLQPLLGPDVELRGYDISPTAIEQAQGRRNDRLHFELGDPPNPGEPVDILLAIDVLEHIEDHLSWLRQIRGRGEYTVFHIPLDLTVHRVIRANALPAIRRRYGHLHYFNRELALTALAETGYQVLDWSYTEEFREGKRGTAGGKLLRFARQASYAASADWTVRVLGGCRLIVLAS